MGCPFLTQPVTKTLPTLTTTIAIEEFTEWYPVCGVDTFRAILRSKAVSGNYQGIVCLQTAEVRTDNPDDWTTNIEAAAHTGAGDWNTGLKTITTNLNEKFWFRFGVGYNLSSGSALGRADATLQVAFDSCGQMQGSKTVSLATSTTSAQVIPVTGWIPRRHAAKLRAAIVITSLTNANIKYAYQFAQVDPEQPGAWTTDVSWPAYATNDEDCTPDLTVPDPTIGTSDKNMWVRFGLMYSAAGAGFGSADVTVVFATRPS